MTQLLEKAFAQASQLSEPEQNALAEWLLEELASEKQWDEAFAQSPDVLARLAEEALADHRAGRTQLLDPDHL
jgi:hypothetical protein